MDTFGFILMMVGYLIGIIGGIWLLVVAFQQSLGWGLGCLLLPIVSIVFAIMYWDDAKVPFLTSLAGGVLIFFGKLLSGAP